MQRLASGKVRRIAFLIGTQREQKNWTILFIFHLTCDVFLLEFYIAVILTRALTKRFKGHLNVFGESLLLDNIERTRSRRETDHEYSRLKKIIKTTFCLYGLSRKLLCA